MKLPYLFVTLLIVMTGYQGNNGESDIQESVQDTTREGLARVWLHDKVGFINQSGEQVTPLKYDGAYSFSEELASVRLSGKVGYVNRSGKEVIPLKYDWAESFNEGRAPVALNDKWGYINRSGEVVIPSKYDYAGSFSD